METLHLFSSSGSKTSLQCLHGILCHPFLRKQLRKYFEQHSVEKFHQFWVALGSIAQLEEQENVFPVLFELTQHLPGFLNEQNLPDIEKILFQHFYPAILQNFTTNVDGIKLMYQFLVFHFQISTEKRKLDTFIIQSILPLYISLFQSTPPFLILHFSFKLLGLILYSNSAFTSIFHRLNLIEPIFHYPSEQISPFYTFSIKLMVESKEIPLSEYYDWGLIPCLLRILPKAEQQHLTLCLIHCVEIIYYLLYSTSKDIREHQAEMTQVLMHTKPLLKSTNQLIRLTATTNQPADQEQFFPFGEITKSSESIVPLAEATARCILLTGQLYGSKFYDLLFQVKAAKRINMRHIEQALGSTNEVVKLKLLRTIRHALRTRSPLNYIYIITHHKNTMEKLNHLSKHPQLEIASVANEIRQLILSNTN